MPISPVIVTASYLATGAPDNTVERLRTWAAAGDGRTFTVGDSIAPVRWTATADYEIDAETAGIVLAETGMAATGPLTWHAESQAGAFALGKGSSSCDGVPIQGHWARRVRATSGGRMNDRERLEQLQGLVGRLERMPVSAERDWMLREVRARAVDVETGVQPDALRARPGHEAEAEIAARPSSAEPPCKRPRVQRPHRTPMPIRRRAVRATPTTAPRAILTAAQPPVTPRPRAQQEAPVDLLEEGHMLCLDDALAASAGPTHPWSRGLRG